MHRMKAAAILLVVAVLAGMAIMRLNHSRSMSKSKAVQLAEAREQREYGPLGESIDEILKHEHTEREYLILPAVFWRIENKSRLQGERNLTQTERMFLIVRRFDAEVNNGGFEQYFHNSAGDNATAALAGLREIGATKAAALLERTMSTFPDGNPPQDRYKRVRGMEKIASEAKPIWDECSSAFYELELLARPLLAFTKWQKAEFKF